MTDPSKSARRPRVVTISSYLLHTVAAITLLSGVLALTTIGEIGDVYRDVLGPSSDEATAAVAVAIGTVAISVLVAGGLVVLALLNNRGKNPSRVVTWVVGGLYLCCSGFGLAGTALTSSFESSAGSGVSAQEINRRLDEQLPSWYNPVSTTAEVLVLLCILVAVILLALPASNAFFRRAKAKGGWDPSQPYPYGGQSPYPGYPQQYQPFPNQPGGGPSYPGQPYPGQPYPGASSGQPFPGSAPGTFPGQQPPAHGQPSPPFAAPPAGEPPHTGSIPPTDPWSAPAREEKPPSDPTASS